ncbi:MAG TPA: hypothetical protein VN776_11435, partial [Terracidiphilus sp.]|nr:hypothetical protein [Terracidiphilus sp.]
MKRLFALLAFSLLIPSFLAAQCPAGLVSNGAGGCVAPMDFYAVASLPPGTTGITRTVRLTTDNSLWRGDGALANWHQISVGVASDGSSTFPGPVTIGNTLPVGAPANSLGVGGNLYVSGNVG